ncbi:hypothetical protein BD289DRAFT_443506 [Coniella lustricola]|uniref:Uncharacterized protein n=1 Tax=Coniella lustricola TaxID=2025994 RepID=A0A2T2ZX12_9PEZI|nr:hypothetical protein BD289DRAFT_443506 [Coniella lustricola]
MRFQRNVVFYAGATNRFVCLSSCVGYFGFFCESVECRLFFCLDAYVMHSLTHWLYHVLLSGWCCTCCPGTRRA